MSVIKLNSRCAHFKNAIKEKNYELLRDLIKPLSPSDIHIPREMVISSNSEFQKDVELLLKWGFIIDPTSNQDNSFVYGAVKNGHQDIVLQLLKSGIDVNWMNPKTGLNLLKIACINEHHEIVENLLKHNASVNDTIPTNIEVLNHLFITYTRWHKLSNLMTNNCIGVTCLHIAVLNKDPKMIELLLNYGATIIDDPNFLHITGMAMRFRCEKIVQIFLNYVPDVKEIGFEGKTLLNHCVIYLDNDFGYEIAKLLLEKGAISQIQAPGNSLTYTAVKRYNDKVVQLFLDNGADVRYVSPNGNTILHQAAKSVDDIEVINTLLRLNLPVNAVNNNMITPLFMACIHETSNQLKIIEALLQCNANIHHTISNVDPSFPSNLKDRQLLMKNKVYSNGQTALHIACKYENDNMEDIIELLLQYNADIEAVDDKGWTPLFVACRSSNELAIKCLLDHQANPNHTDLANLTPLYFAAKHFKRNSEILHMFLNHKINFHCMDNQGNSIIHLIVEHCNDVDLIRRLASTHMNFNSVNKEGNTPLHIAVKRQAYDVIENLIKYGANVNILDKQKRTPFRNSVDDLLSYYKKYEIFQDWNSRRFSRKNSSNDSFPECLIDFDEDYDSSEYVRITSVLKRQIIKLKVAGLHVNKQNEELVYKSECYGDKFFDRDDINDTIDISGLERQCEEEIERMKVENIGINNWNFYDVLTRNIDSLSKYVKNKRMQQTLALEIYDKKFPLYIDIVRSRFRDAKLRYRFKNAAIKYSSSNLRPRLSDDCLDRVFSYLKLKELKMIIRAIKPFHKSLDPEKSIKPRLVSTSPRSQSSLRLEENSRILDKSYDYDWGFTCDSGWFIWN